VSDKKYGGDTLEELLELEEGATPRATEDLIDEILRLNAVADELSKAATFQMLRAGISATHEDCEACGCRGFQHGIACEECNGVGRRELDKPLPARHLPVTLEPREPTEAINVESCKLCRECPCPAGAEDPFDIGNPPQCPGFCPRCGEPWDWVRAGKAQPNCKCQDWSMETQ
jgi:hypothetical protein